MSSHMREVETSIVASVTLRVAKRFSDEQIADALADAEFAIGKMIELYVADDRYQDGIATPMVKVVSIRFGAILPDEVDIHAEREPMDWSDEAYVAPFRQ